MKTYVKVEKGILTPKTCPELHTQHSYVSHKGGEGQGGGNTETQRDRQTSRCKHRWRKKKKI